ncbi:MAG: hypothetical protein QNL04_03545 [SAR324 cluster bacterium]|nr:hypothetical protein [SAR324 cluster bacterium]
MAANFISNLPPAAKIWAAEALAGIIVSDGVVTGEELALLRESIAFLDDIEQVGRIVEKIKNKERVTLEILRCERKMAANILMSLAMAAMTDDKISPPEVEYFVYVAGKLGFDMQFAHRVIRWGQDFIKLNKEKKTLVTIGSSANAMYQ